MSSTLSRAALFAVFVGVSVVANLPVVRAVVELSRRDSTASHLILVPLVTMVLIYQNRQSIFLAVRWSWLAGAAAVVASLVLLVAGSRIAESGSYGDALSIQVAGLVGLWLGGFLLVYGPAVFRKALFPLLFLCFTIPLPRAVIDAATQTLKTGSAELVAVLFAISGTPVHRDGFVFSLPTVVIEVADACSGIRSSIALILTGLLAGYMFLGRLWARSLVVAAVIPITILKNAVRIVTLSLLAIHVDPGFLSGQLHHEGGIVFFLLGLLMLAPLFAWLRHYDVLRLPRAPSADAA